MTWLLKLGGALLDTLINVLPIALIVLVFQIAVIRQPIPQWRSLLIGFVYVLLGLTLFLLGLEQALFPIGRLMAQQLTATSAVATAATVDWTDYYWVYLFAVSVGFSTTLAEPALMAVALKANEVSGGAVGVWGLRIAVAIGASIGLGLGTLRIVLGAPIHGFIIAAYVIVLIQTYWAPRLIVPLAYDSGGVTTSTVTVPIVAALGLGLAETVPGRNPLVDGFGLIAFVCLFPIITVMAYAQLAAYQARRVARRRALGEAPVSDHAREP